MPECPGSQCHWLMDLLSLGPRNQAKMWGLEAALALGGFSFPNVSIVPSSKERVEMCHPGAVKSWCHRLGRRSRGVGLAVFAADPSQSRGNHPLFPGVFWNQSMDQDREDLKIFFTPFLTLTMLINKLPISSRKKKSFLRIWLAEALALLKCNSPSVSSCHSQSKDCLVRMLADQLR